MSLTTNAYAKINLTLEVLGKRTDGYHEVSTVMQTISLADELIFQEALNLDVCVEDANIAVGQNLVYQAASLLRSHVAVRSGVVITVRKRIPLAAGLGGGSSDAASTLLALKDLWGVGVSMGELESIASGLGSDVPFFLRGGTALAEGRGDVLRPLRGLEPAWLLVSTPPTVQPDAKTATLYRMLSPEMFSDGRMTKKLVDGLGEGVPVGQLDLQNVFENVAFEAFPGLGEHWEKLLAAGASRVHLCGSGPALFTIVEGEDAGLEMQLRCASLGVDSILVRTVGAAV